MYRLVETIKIENGTALALKYHHRRMNTARRELFDCLEEISLKEIIHCPFSFGVCRCRVIYDQDIERIEYRKYEPFEVDSLKIVKSDAIEYAYKYEDRSELDKLFAQRGECSDILIVKNGKITDTSRSNVAFLREGKWYTPAEPLLAGTKRARLLDEGRIIIEEIRPDDLRRFETVAMLSAFRDMDTGSVLPVGRIFL